MRSRTVASGIVVLVTVEFATVEPAKINYATVYSATEGSAKAESAWGLLIGICKCRIC
jgi:hypothetical protein